MSETNFSTPDWDWIESCFLAGAWDEQDAKTQSRLSEHFTPEQFNEERLFFLQVNEALSNDIKPEGPISQGSANRFGRRYIFPISGAAAAILLLSWWLVQPGDTTTAIAYLPQERPVFSAPEGEAAPPEHASDPESLTERSYTFQTEIETDETSHSPIRETSSDIPATTAAQPSQTSQSYASDAEGFERNRGYVEPIPAQGSRVPAAAMEVSDGSGMQKSARINQATSLLQPDTLQRNDSLFLRFRDSKNKDSLIFLKIVPRKTPAD